MKWWRRSPASRFHVRKSYTFAAIHKVQLVTTHSSQPTYTFRIVLGVKDEESSEAWEKCALQLGWKLPCVITARLSPGCNKLNFLAVTFLCKTLIFKIMVASRIGNLLILLKESKFHAWISTFLTQRAFFELIFFSCPLQPGTLSN